MQRVLAVVTGLVVGVLVIAAVEMLGHVIFPTPPGVNAHDPEQMKQVMSKLPPGALLFVLLGWALGAFAGGFTAAKIAGRRFAAVTVGAILTLAGVWTMMEIPHPWWMWVFAIAATPVMAGLGGRLAAPSSRAAQA